LKQIYEEQISVLQKQNEEAIENLAIAFKESLKKTQEDYEETRETAENLKLKYEERLSMQEDEHEAEILELKKKFEKEVEEQTSDNTALRRKNEALSSEQQMFSEEKESLRLKNDKKLNAIESLEETKAELLAQVKFLEQDKNDKDNLLIEKEKKIYEFKNEIKKLDKQKHVQDARKKEILEELQPKDEEINKLHGFMKKVHGDCDFERIKNNELKKNISEREEMISRLRFEAKQIHNQIEERDRSLRQITNDIYNTVNNMEQKDWPSELDSLYERYVKKELSKVSKKDPECIEEMEEQLKYMQKSIGFMKQSQNQVMYRSKSDLKKRTDENSTLIKELQDLRLVKNNNAQAINKLEYELNTLLRAMNAKEAGQSKGASKQGSSSNLPSINPLPIPVARPSSSKPKAGARGKLYKGSPFESKLINVQEKQRISELQKDLDERKEENFYLKLEINQLREQLSKVEEDPSENNL
jgi:chromosome segregation ATPase